MGDGTQWSDSFTQDDYKAMVKDMFALGATRISIGVQSFDDGLLSFLGRVHSSSQAKRAVELAQIRFDNVSIDLMCGLPGQTEEGFRNDLELALQLGVKHVSVYPLMVEEGTPLFQRVEKGIDHIDEDLGADLMQVAAEVLGDAGMHRYEVASYAFDGFESRHNTAYWKGIPYLGCGPSAHSFNAETREWNTASLEGYIKSIEEGHRSSETEILDKVTRYNEYIMTSLRTMWGISLTYTEEAFGTELCQYCTKMAAPYLQSHKLEMQADRLRLTREGIFVSDGIISDLMFID